MNQKLWLASPACGLGTMCEEMKQAGKIRNRAAVPQNNINVRAHVEAAAASATELNLGING